MTDPSSQKVTASHLARRAMLYVRQSTPHQVLHNQESTRRQYDLRLRAIGLGWNEEQIDVVDTDLGQSGASAVDRVGFQRLVAEVGMGHVGVVLGLEVSRLARNNADWHRLLELCALTDTLILDEDSLYDPNSFNDRLLLGLKGTMSEAELHILRARLRGGLLAKARRGELKTHPPLGFVYDLADRVVLDPDQEVQAFVRGVFSEFARLGAACAVVRSFQKRGLKFPLRPLRGPRRGELQWGDPELSRVLSILKSPRYAGAWVWGRKRMQRLPDGRRMTRKVPAPQWHAFLRDAHPSYISWEEHLGIQERIRATAVAFGQDRRRGPPREGSALLQGRVLCGRCGRRMIVRYHRRRRGLLPDYVCAAEQARRRGPQCQLLPGESIDQAISLLMMEAMTKEVLGMTIAVQEELGRRGKEGERLRQMQVERARYEVDLAQRRYLAVDPNHRLVAASLEADWNERLRALEEARQNAERQRVQDELSLNDQARRRILGLAEDFPTVWTSPNTPSRERKRLVALVVEDVTLTGGDTLRLQVRLLGGASKEICLPKPISPNDGRRTPKAVVALIDELLQESIHPEVVRILNERGLKTGDGAAWTERSVDWICTRHKLLHHSDRLALRGWMNTAQMAGLLATDRTELRARVATQGILRRQVNRRGDWMYAPLDGQPVEVQRQANQIAARREAKATPTTTGPGAV